jgi:uncharacterized membrane protein
MDPLPLILVIISAVSHSLWNFLAKEGKDKESFMLLLNIISLILFLPVFYFIIPNIYFPIQVLPYLIISGIAETLYFFGLGKAYETGDLSLVYPIARSSPVLVSIAAFILLGEVITFIGVISILIIFSGIYILHLKRLTSKELTAPITYLKTGSSKYAILAALGTTIYSISDKIGVTKIDPLLYSFWLGFFITSMLLAFTVYRRGIEVIRQELTGSLTRISISGVLMKGGYILVLYAMSLAQVSYILALRQISIVLGALMGIIFLGEKYGNTRIIGSVIIFIGAYLLTVFA